MRIGIVYMYIYTCEFMHICISVYGYRNKVYIYQPKPSKRAGFDSRSIFMRSLTGLTPRPVAILRTKIPVNPIIYLYLDGE